MIKCSCNKRVICRIQQRKLAKRILFKSTFYQISESFQKDLKVGNLQHKNRYAAYINNSVLITSLKVTCKNFYKFMIAKWFTKQLFYNK